MFRRLKADIDAILERDPAARSRWEVVTCYPGLHAIVLHRLAHACWRAGWKWLGRWISHWNRWLTGIEIHPGARIGQRVFIDHGMGVVIGETAEIGDNVTLYQGVTLGGTGKQRGKRHPTVEKNAVIGVGAKVLGAINIGENARVGAGAVVLHDVPANATAVGVPAKVVVFRPTGQPAQRVEQLPDPEAEMITCLHRKILELEDRLTSLEEELKMSRSERLVEPTPMSIKRSAKGQR
ncbi:MAG: serine O-acetyltransferase [Dehalococcoidia bacterium]|nr:serine O-acetyltransferase [Dehalococcoidia bacterium]